MTDDRERQEIPADHDSSTRDQTPALGTRGEPASWQRAVENGEVALAKPSWGDAAWSYLFGRDTRYAGDEDGDAADEAVGDEAVGDEAGAAAGVGPEQVAAANLRMRSGAMPESIQGPVLHAPVWTWEVPLYFWLGGVASGAAFAALAADLAGDEESAAVARKVALGAVLPAPALLIADLGRPERFLNMLRIFKPRSPMNMGAWCLMAFSTAGGGAVAADLLGSRPTAKWLGAAEALLGSYLGSYTGVLLATTAVPVWARSRLFLGPIFVATATATGAAATRLVLAATGQAENHPTHVALARLEASAILAELTLSTVNERRLGRAGQALEHGAPGHAFRAAKTFVSAGLVLTVIGRPGSRRGTIIGGARSGRGAQNLASVLYLAGGLAFRVAWVKAGRASAQDDEAVALMARARVTADEGLRVGGEQRRVSEDRPPLASGAPARLLSTWSATVGRASLLVERLIRRAR